VTTTIHLIPSAFQWTERTLVDRGSLSASTFLFESGVHGVRLRNEHGELVMLPFQGQQIWSARFGERILTMRSMFDEPRPTRDYLQNYGGFLLHCGFTAMGVPGPEDSHPLHGELPNAPYQRAHIVLGEDERGAYIGLGGAYQHTVAFSYNYVAEPLVKLYAGASRFHIAMHITNLKQTPMEYMYLAHVNFRPVDNGRLVYSAVSTPEHVRVRTSIPAHVTPGPDYVALLEDLQVHPEKHHVLRPELAFDPEIVFNIDYLADDAGWAHSMQRHPDGSADYIAHRPDQLPVGVRWICRTPDQDALGIVLPATAGPEGYTAEKAKGGIPTLAGGATFVCEMEVAVLPPDEAQRMEQTIEQTIEQIAPENAA
jgi:hypothetical protein